jgi:very-short-patch-repair endonuclease
MGTILNNKNNKHFRKQLRQDQTDVEKLLWHHLRNKQMLGLKFYRQYGVTKYIVDFYCPKLRLAVELDGGQHHEELIKDELRSSDLAKLGIRVVRFWNNEVLENLDGVLEKIVEEVSFNIGTPPTSS